MFRLLFKHRIRRHAQRVFASLFPKGYAGEVFLCGGAFKPLLRKGLPINDLDLWVRNRKERDRLVAALSAGGAHLIHDFHPFCMKFRHEGQLVEITYHNVKDGDLSDVINTFDLSLCGLGARYSNGKVEETYVSAECWNAIHHRQITVMDSYMLFLMLQNSPSILRSLHRMGQQAAELGFQVHEEQEHHLWDLYWRHYSEEERKAAMDLYFDTVVAYKGQSNERLVRRASIGSTATRAQAELGPLPLVPQPA